MPLLCADALHDAAREGDNALVAKLLDNGFVEISRTDEVSAHTYRHCMCTQWYCGQSTRLVFVTILPGLDIGV